MSTYEDVVNYLKSYRELKYNIEFYRNKMGGLKAISYSQEEKGTSMQDTMSLYMQKIEDAEKTMKIIEEFIEINFDGIERLAIWNRYINFDKLDKIAKDLNYSRSGISKIISTAIENYVFTINCIQK